MRLPLGGREVLLGKVDWRCGRNCAVDEAAQKAVVFLLAQEMP